MAKYLKDKAGYNLSDYKGADNETCLHLAVQRKNFDMMKLLVDHDPS